ncbi:MAG: winged helix-turn-helix transcriptional regulator [Gelidibacter sp.]|nr:winged helix-turn-helix transcriptional regulator [Gelidibacter sp.]
MPENNRIEFKQKVTDHLEKEVVAFLNYLGGGIIYIGIANDGKIIGIEDIDQVQLQIKDRIKNNIAPSCMGLFDVVAETRDEKDIIKLIIASGQERPYYIKKYGMSSKGAFMRSGSASEPMTARMIEDLFIKRTKTSIGKMASPNQELKFEQLRIYYDAMGKTLQTTFPKSLELLTADDKLNYVAYLLADNNNTSVKVAKYAGTTRVDLIQTEEFGFCSLIKATKQVLDKIEVENKTFTTITSKERIEKKQWNTVALREAVINAMVHNDYTYELAPKFEFFSDRFEITSYGTLPQGVSKEEFFQGVSIPRSKEIMRVFRDMDLVEQLGSGVPRILQSYGQECFYFSENFTRMSFPMDEEVQKTVVETVVETVGKTAREIMEILKINPNSTSEAIAKQLKISIRGVEYNLNKLKKLGIIRREGATKNGKWLVI